MLSKVSVDEVFMHYFEKMSSASPPNPGWGSTRRPRWGTSVLQIPLLPTGGKNPGGTQIRLHRYNRVSVSCHTNDCCTVKVASEILVPIEDAYRIDVDFFQLCIHVCSYYSTHCMHRGRYNDCRIIQIGI